MSYATLSAASVSLIAKFGRTFSLLCTSSTQNDALKPWRGTNNSTMPKAQPKGVFTQFDVREVDGERIRSTDVKVLVAAADPAFATADAGFDIKNVAYADDGGTRYGATEVSDVAPGDTPLVKTLRLRLT